MGSVPLDKEETRTVSLLQQNPGRRWPCASQEEDPPPEPTMLAPRTVRKKCPLCEPWGPVLPVTVHESEAEGSPCQPPFPLSPDVPPRASQHHTLYTHYPGCPGCQGT